VAAGGSGGGTPATVAELSDTHTHTQLQTDRHTDRQTDIHPDSQTARQPDRPALYHMLMRRSLIY
ncbi:hypothetical protein M433DRAFT_160233, partial [Acidomyces richmondensis BFW]